MWIETLLIKSVCVSLLDVAFSALEPVDGPVSLRTWLPAFSIVTTCRLAAESNAAIQQGREPDCWVISTGVMVRSISLRRSSDASRNPSSD